jgi:tetratricopeptide (TPR) repeat protein
MTDDAVAAVEARLERIRVSGDLSISLESAAVREMRNLRRVPGWDHDLRARRALGWLHWCRYLALPEGRDMEDGEAALTALLPCFVAGVEPMPDGLLPELAAAAFPMASFMLAQATSSRGSEPVSAVVELYRRILAATPQDDVSNRAKVLAMLGMALQDRFGRSGVMADLDEAVEVGWLAADTIPAGHRERFGIMVNLAAALRLRFDRTGAASGRSDIDAVVEVLRRAAAEVPARGPERTGLLMTLCAALRARYDQYGDRADVEAAIDAGRQAVSGMPDDDVDQSRILVNLGVALMSRFGLSAAPADLAEAIDSLGRALGAIPARHPDRCGIAASLAAALWTRFGVTGADDDLDKAIDILREALADPPEIIADRARLLSNLSVGLWGRFVRSDAAADLDAAIDIGRQAIDSLPRGDVNLARFHANLSVALRARFERGGTPEDIDMAVAAAREAVAATAPGHLDRARYLTGLGNALHERFRRREVAEDLAGAITALSEAAKAVPADHPDRVKILSNQGNVLRTLYEQTGVPGDLDDAITVLRTSVQAAQTDRPEWAGCLFNLGKALRTRFERTESADDQAEALSRLSAVADIPTAAPYLRAQAARSAAALAADGHVHDAAKLMETAVHLLPAIAPRHIVRGDQERRIGEFAGLAAEAASLALLDVREPETQAERAARALGLLEAGRGILLSQALDMHSDVAMLDARDHSLAKRFVHLRDQLDRAPAEDPAGSPDSSGPTALQLERGAGDRHRLAADFTATVTKIRALPGYARFMLAPDLPDLLADAGPCTVVALNVSRYRSDALILAQGTITDLLLPDLTLASLADKIDLLERVLDRTNESDASIGELANANKALSQILEWLWDTVAGPVLDHLGHRGPSGPGAALPRIWWMPSGLLGLLPVHAAGYHSERDGRTALDRVISSYTPTVRALGYARGRTTSAPPERSLIVAMPTTPGDGVQPLRHVAGEARMLQGRLPDPTLLIETSGPAGGQSPTRALVLAGLADAGIAHFACHAASNPAEPSRGMLVLHDHEVNPLTVASLAPVRLTHAQLAFLSACQTSRNTSAELSDESIHLTSAFQLAGYPHVIGTLWQIYDSFAADIAEAFYDRLRTGPRVFATGSAAEALHDAIRRKRDHGYASRPLMWAAYLHAGA